MRLLMVGIIASAMMVFGSLSANAYTIDITNTGSATVGVGDSITIVMSGDFDAGTILWSASLGFDASLVSYNQAGSDSLSGVGYALYEPGGGKGAPATMLLGLTAGGCPGYGDPGAGGGCGTWSPAPPNAVWINLISNLGTSGGISGSGNVEIASMAFVANSPGVATFDILFDASVGAVINTDGGGTPQEVAPTSISSPILVTIVPEPTTALLIGLGLAGLAVAGRRRA